MGRGFLLLSDAVAKDLPRDLLPYPYREKKLDEVDELYSLVRFLKLKELRLLRLGANSLQFHILALIQSGRGCLDERPYQNTTLSFQINPI